MTNLITPHHSKKMGCEYGVDQTEQQIEREVSSVISKQRIASPSSSLPSSSPSSTLASNIRAKNTSGSARARPPVNKAGDEVNCVTTTTATRVTATATRAATTAMKKIIAAHD
jgi:hypothetical protein